MPKTLDAIPADAAIVQKNGVISIFFRLRWEVLRTLATLAATLAVVRSSLTQAAAVVTTAAWTTKSGGQYRVTWYIRKTAADGVSSSLTVTIGAVDTGVAVAFVGAALTTDSVVAVQSGSVIVEADISTDLTFAIAYASNTPGAMKFRYTIVVEQMA